MELTYYGHACFAVTFNNIRLLFDPFITHNPLEEAKKIDVNAIQADYILLSHGHADHSLDCMSIAQRTGATVIGMVEITDFLDSQGLEAHGMNIGGQANFRNGSFTREKGDFKVKCVVAQHSSSMPVDNSYAGSPVGFLVTTDEASFYYSGDTGLTMDMQLIPRWAKLNFAVLPIGDNFTMGPEDALECAKMIECKTIVGVHYDTYAPLIQIDKEWAKNVFNQAGYDLKLPKIGETITI
ncbi:MAG TPA: metal-dependent hydrolase [Chitinophagaceae bacterium]|nr:metal-dependent hydrolase [Chitinophagaceae bacterium]